MSLNLQIAALQQELDGIVALGDTSTEEQVTRGHAIVTEIQNLQESLARREALAVQSRELSTQLAQPATKVSFGAPQVASIPAVALNARLRNITSKNGVSAGQRAYTFGHWFLGNVLGAPNSQRWLQSNAVNLAQGQNINIDGGFLVPDEYSSDIIDLREQFGVFAKYAKVHQMASDTARVPRRNSGVTAYFTTENNSITTSQMSWDQVTLSAKKLACYVPYSNELGENAIVNIADTLMEEVAYAFAAKEDDCGFNGDGTSTYGGIMGARAALRNVDSTISNIKGLFVGAGNLYSELTLADFNGTKGKLPAYARTADVAWYVHSVFYETVMEKLLFAAGGVTAQEIASGRKDIMFLGYPVIFAQQMPSVEGNSQVCAIFGNLKLGALLGRNNMMSLASSAHVAFQSDQIVVRGTDKFDVVVHGVGDTTNAGPVVGLITAAS